MTDTDARRMPLHAGMLARVPCYTLHAEQILAVATAYLRELGFTPTQEGQITGEQTMLHPPDLTDVTFSVYEQLTPILITVHLSSSNGDIRLVSETEHLLISPPPEDVG